MSLNILPNAALESIPNSYKVIPTPINGSNANIIYLKLPLLTFIFVSLKVRIKIITAMYNILIIIKGIFHP